jgi:molybdopterin biosynthesis enzyme
VAARFRVGLFVLGDLALRLLGCAAADEVDEDVAEREILDRVAWQAEDEDAALGGDVDAILEETVKSRPGVRNFVRAVAEEREGRWYVRRAGEQGSAMLRTMVQSNALLVVPETAGRLNAGDVVRVQLLDLPEAE